MVSHELLAKLFLARGDIESVILHLEPVAEQKPAVQLDLARMYNKLNRQVMKAQAAAHAEKFLSAEIAKLGTSPLQEGDPDTLKTQRLNLIMNWSEALVLQDKLDDAAKVATEALDRNNSPELRRR